MTSVIWLEKLPPALWLCDGHSPQVNMEAFTRVRGSYKVIVTVALWRPKIFDTRAHKIWTYLGNNNWAILCVGGHVMAPQVQNSSQELRTVHMNLLFIDTQFTTTSCLLLFFRTSVVKGGSFHALVTVFKLFRLLNLLSKVCWKKNIFMVKFTCVFYVCFVHNKKLGIKTYMIMR